jgi:hypothetical protein
MTAWFACTCDLAPIASAHELLTIVLKDQSRLFVHRLPVHTASVLFASGAHVVLCLVGLRRLGDGSGLAEFLFRIYRVLRVGVRAH